MLKDLLKFVGYGLGFAIILPPLIAVFAVMSVWTTMVFVTFLAFL